MGKMVHFNMKLGKAYERGSWLKKSFIFSVLNVSFGISCNASIFTRNTRRISLIRKFAYVCYWNTLPIIIELHCKWRRQTRIDTENFIDRYRIL
jgi:hypothetical protein